MDTRRLSVKTRKTVLSDGEAVFMKRRACRFYCSRQDLRRDILLSIEILRRERNANGCFHIILEINLGRKYEKLYSYNKPSYRTTISRKRLSLYSLLFAVYFNDV